MPDSPVTPSILVADDQADVLDALRLVLKVSGFDTESANSIAMVRERIGPVASFKVATVVERLPKTRSGKVLRSTCKKIADGLDYRIPPTIEDPIVLTEIKASLDAIGYPRR